MKFDEWLNEKEAKIGKTTKDKGHYHNYEVNDDGDGKTTSTIDGDDHVHKITNWEVQESNGHIHKLNTDSDKNKKKKKKKPDGRSG